MEGFFSTKIRNFKFWKMPELLNFTIPEGWYFLNCDNTELKRSPKIFFFCFRTAWLGDGGLTLWCYDDLILRIMYLILYYLSICVHVLASCTKFIGSVQTSILFCMFVLDNLSGTYDEIWYWYVKKIFFWDWKIIIMKMLSF